MSRKGILYGFIAYLIWGFFPVYFKALQGTPALEIMFHRVVWSFILLGGILLIRKEWQVFKQDALQPKRILVYTLAGILLASNWLLYIWAVNDGQVVESSLGYFINPLVNVLLGVVFLREQLRPTQWIPVGLAATGVLYLTIEYGALPWIALALAFSFGTYGLVKKIAPLGPLHSLLLETAALFIPALGYLLFIANQGGGSFGHAGWGNAVLLILAGVVTAVPLLLFTSAARGIPLSLLGILQYIAPTTQFLLGVLAYGEPFTPARVIGFTIIWTALAIYWLEGRIAGRGIPAPAPAD